jgi:hypothetical protein
MYLPCAITTVSKITNKHMAIPMTIRVLQYPFHHIFFMVPPVFFSIVFYDVWDIRVVYIRQGELKHVRIWGVERIALYSQSHYWRSTGHAKKKSRIGFIPEKPDKGKRISIGVFQQ